MGTGFTVDNVNDVLKVDVTPTGVGSMTRVEWEGRPNEVARVPL